MKTKVNYTVETKGTTLGELRELLEHWVDIDDKSIVDISSAWENDKSFWEITVFFEKEL